MDAGLKEGIDYGLHDLPERLHEADHPGVCATLWIRSRMLHPNSCRISPAIHIYWNISTSSIHLPGFFGGEVLSLSRIGIVEPSFEVLCVDVGVSACVVGAEASEHCLHLYLC